MTARELALKFHEAYERMAPSFGYETRTETRAFDPESANGRLMIAVCSELLPYARQALSAVLPSEQEEREAFEKWHRENIEDVWRSNRGELWLAWKARASQALAPVPAHDEQRCERMSEALEKIAQWARAYPLSVFPEPDFARAHEVLSAAGMTLDAISASNMRHVITQVQAIVDAAMGGDLAAAPASAPAAREDEGRSLTFSEFRRANATRCVKWHPEGIASWSASDWMTAIVGELGELASLIKMRNRERDGLPGNKFSPTDEQIANEAADVLTYLDLFCEMHGIDLGTAAARKFNEVSERVGFPDRITIAAPSYRCTQHEDGGWWKCHSHCGYRSCDVAAPSGSGAQAAEGEKA